MRREYRAERDAAICAISPSFDEPEGKISSENHPYKKVCDRCPIVYRCYMLGTVHNENGLWGGKTRTERRRISDQDLLLLLQEAVSLQLFHLEFLDTTLRQGSRIRQLYLSLQREQSQV